MPGAGFEPACGFPRAILSRLRMPIPPPRRSRPHRIAPLASEIQGLQSTGGAITASVRAIVRGPAPRDTGRCGLVLSSSSFIYPSSGIAWTAEPLPKLLPVAAVLARAGLHDAGGRALPRRSVVPIRRLRNRSSPRSSGRRSASVLSVGLTDRGSLLRQPAPRARTSPRGMTGPAFRDPDAASARSLGRPLPPRRHHSGGTGIAGLLVRALGSSRTGPPGFVSRTPHRLAKSDPIFGYDIGFYVFQLPALEAICSYLLTHPRFLPPSRLRGPLLPWGHRRSNRLA